MSFIQLICKTNNFNPNMDSVDLETETNAETFTHEAINF